MLEISYDRKLFNTVINGNSYYTPWYILESEQHHKKR